MKTNTIYINNGEAFFGSIAWAFLSKEAAQAMIDKQSAEWFKDQAEKENPETLEEIKGVGWAELTGYEFRGTDQQWQAIVAAAPEQRSEIENMGFDFVEDSSEDIAFVHPSDKE